MPLYKITPDFTDFLVDIEIVLVGIRKIKFMWYQSSKF